MKHLVFIKQFIFLVMFVFINSCHKDEINLPVVETLNITNINVTYALGGGYVKDDGGAPVTIRGVCWSDINTPSVENNSTKDGRDTGMFKSDIIGLSHNTIYYVRAYATNSAGTGYGVVISFKTKIYGTVTDIDGNNYKTINIGNQTWMAENLKVTHYQKTGDSIPILISVDSGKGACYDYDDTLGNSIIYGKLYNWYAVVDWRNLCPSGWHVPSTDEWDTLITYLGGGKIAAVKLKEAGNSHWKGTNTATNESGFTALPAGLYEIKSYYLGTRTYWWASNCRCKISLENDSIWVYPGGVSRAGQSVRCKKD